MQKYFAEHKVIICAGSGGVGKTTVAAALGLKAAQLGRKVLVLTIDPARRLATSLGLDLNSTGDVEVPGLKGKMFAAVVNHEHGFMTFIKEASADDKLANKILANLFVQQLSTQLSGSQEFTSLDRLLRSYETGGYDNIILDTPPSQHAMEFLTAPQKIYTLFQKSITKWFTEETKNKNFVLKILSKGTQSVLSAFERVTGTQFMRELADFFDVIRHIQDQILDRSVKAQRLLMSADTAFILVSGIDTTKIKEAEEFIKDLRRMGHQPKGLIVNRALPVWFEDGDKKFDEELAGSSINKADHQAIEEIFKKYRSYYADRVSEHAELKRRMGTELPIVFLRQQNNDIFGLDGLQKIADEISASYNS